MDITETREEKDIQIELIASYLEGLYNANDARRIRELLSDRDGWRETARQSQRPWAPSVEFLQGEYCKLLKIIEDAEHPASCGWHYSYCGIHSDDNCNCFKSKVTE